MKLILRMLCFGCFLSLLPDGVHDIRAAEKGKKTAAKESAKGPTAPPRFLTISAVHKDSSEIDLMELLTKFAYETVEETREKDGKEETVTVQVAKPVTESRVTKVKVESGQVFDAAGQSLSAKDMWKHLKLGAVVLVSSDGREVDPRYLKLVKKNTPVLVLPAYRGASTPHPSPMTPSKKAPSPF